MIHTYDCLSRKDLRILPVFDSITFSENLNYWQESLLEVIRQNIAGHCQQVLKFRIMGVCSRCKDETLLGVVNKLLKTKSLLIPSSNVLPYYLK